MEIVQWFDEQSDMVRGTSNLLGAYTHIHPARACMHAVLPSHLPTWRRLCGRHHDQIAMPCPCLSCPIALFNAATTRRIRQLPQASFFLSLSWSQERERARRGIRAGRASTNIGHSSPQYSFNQCFFGCISSSWKNIDAKFTSSMRRCLFIQSIE